ncbi:MAG: cupin domain-containing protein [Actinobacteria bacterium]|nr:cupin domain-containing protein [Actinomycetota bacterium]
MTEPRFKVVAYRDVEASVFGDEAPGVTIRQLISGEADGAPIYNMRMIEIEPGGNTPDHDHPFEHENFIVSGSGEVTYEGAAYPVSAGDVVFLPPGARHQYRNTGEEPLVFLCGIPVSRGC